MQVKNDMAKSLEEGCVLKIFHRTFCGKFCQGGISKGIKIASFDLHNKCFCKKKADDFVVCQKTH